MQREAITELFDYTGWAWERVARLIEAQPPGIYSQPVAGSGWPSIAACLSHAVFTYDIWLNGPWVELKLGEMSSPTQWPKPIDDWDAMKAYRERTRDSFRDALDVPDEVLYERRFREAGAAGELLSRADILTNLVIHERGHHGDLNTLFHQHGIPSYIIDYTFFRTLPDQFVLDDEEQ